MRKKPQSFGSVAKRTLSLVFGFLLEIGFILGVMLIVLGITSVAAYIWSLVG